MSCNWSSSENVFSLLQDLQIRQIQQCLSQVGWKLEGDRTWNNFKVQFAAAYRQHRQMQGETLGAQAFANATITQASEDDLAEQALGTFANFATSTAVDRNVVAQLTEANSRLAKQLEDNSTSRKEVKALLKKECAERASGGNTDRPPRRSFTPSSDNYCWSHGYKVARTYTSQTCMYPKEGHQHEATKTNNMGGSQVSIDWLLGVTSKINNKTFYDCRTPPLLKHNETALVDSGCTGHFLLSNAPCLNNTLASNTLTVRLPNGQTMKSTHTATLDIPQLSKVTKAAHVFPAMENNSLLSVGQLCDEVYSVLFRTDGVKILNEKQKIIMKGPRDHATGLCRINLLQKNPTCTISQPPSQPHSANNVYALRNSGALFNYLHKAMFSCTKYDLVHAIKRGHLVTWPGLTVEAVNKHLKLTPATDMGHMNQRRQNTRSTKPKLIAQDD
jgi:hypothetical protein